MQSLGILACLTWAGGVGYAVYKVLEWKVGLRVTPAEEFEGLSIGNTGRSDWTAVRTAEMEELRRMLESVPEEGDNAKKPS